MGLIDHRDAILAIAAQHKAHDVRVFGSVARGADGPDSDLDLLVTFDPDATVFDQLALAAAIEDLVGMHVDVISEGGLTGRHEQIRHEARPL